MNTFLKAHLTSLKLLIIDIFILPGKIYSKTLCVLAKGDKKKDSDFWVLHWITKCYDAIIGLSYTVGLILFFLALINVIDSSMYEYSWSELGNDYEKSLNFFSVLLHLVMIYFLPLYIHLIKEFFSIPILQVIRINEIAKNTKK